MAKFQPAFLITIDANHEGGFQKLHDDKGNWTGNEVGVGELKGTKYGISAAEFPNLDIENLTTDQAAAIYKEQYWKPHYEDVESQPVANKLFDMGVLFGVGTDTKVMQAVLNLLPPDGVFGPVTLAKVNEADAHSLLSAFKTGMVTHAIEICNKNPLERPFLKDWIRRINDTTGEDA